MKFNWKETQFTALVWYALFVVGMFIGMMLTFVGVPLGTSATIMVVYVLVLIPACIAIKTPLPLLTIFTDYGFGAGLIFQPCWNPSRMVEIAFLIFWGTTTLLAVLTATVLWMKYSSEIFPDTPKEA